MKAILLVLISAVAAAAQTIPAGTALHVRLDQSLDTRHNHAGDRFAATLIDPVQVDARTLVPKGARCTGHLLESKPSGRFKGRAVLSLSLDSFELNGRRFDIDTTHVARASGRHRKRNWL